ncbi:hypothetical protein AB9P05_01780 [Roseivirga sp. BDSF3-8]|uniref:hypothetical protein n=1 Tax=Roseivirga sp. BDSF3-8 TaxID=3241598 RepID=UPI0035323FFB
MTDIFGIFKSFFDPKIKFSHRAGVAIILIFIAALINDVLSFTFYYRNSYKIEQVEKLNKIIADTTLSSSTKKNMVALREEIIEHTPLSIQLRDKLFSISFKEDTISNERDTLQAYIRENYISKDSARIIYEGLRYFAKKNSTLDKDVDKASIDSVLLHEKLSLDSSSIDEIDISPKNKIQRNSTIHFISSTWWILLFMVGIFFTALADKKLPISERIGILIIVEIIAFVIAWGLANILATIPIFIAPWFNYYFINAFIPPTLLVLTGLIGRKIFPKAESKKDGPIEE